MIVSVLICTTKVCRRLPGKELCWEGFIGWCQAERLRRCWLRCLHFNHISISQVKSGEPGSCFILTPVTEFITAHSDEQDISDTDDFINEIENNLANSQHINDLLNIFFGVVVDSEHGLHVTIGDGAAGPLEVACHQHVLDHGLDGHLPHQPHEEQLLDDGGRHCSERWKSEEKLAKPCWLIGVVRLAVLLQSTLRLLLELLNHLRRCQPDSVWKY